MTVELITFLLGSIGIGILSRHALAVPGSHGFPRFFAFEALLGLGIMNSPAWFIDPFSVLHILSWILLIVSAILVLASLIVFYQFGKPDPSLPEANRLGFEKTTCLVTVGPYRLIRHPMYSALLCLAWGIFLKQITFLSSMLVICVSLALYVTSLFEEQENLSFFKESYAAYMQATKRFIPFLF